MKRMMCLLGVWGFFLAGIPTTGLGASEQWLAYKYSREARRIVSGVGSRSIRAVKEAPEGVKTPDFSCDTPYFVQWETPMVPGGKVCLAMDSTNANNSYDRLYLDSDADGDLSDEEPSKPYQTDDYRAYFGPVKVLFKGEDGPITYHVSVDFYKHEETTFAYVRSSSWYEGKVDLGGEKRLCTLIDRNANGTFNDCSLEARNCDGIRIGDPAKSEVLYVGRYVQADGKLYECEIAQDGAFVKLAEARDVKYGRIRVADSISELVVSGENGLFTVHPEKGLGEVPTGKYRVQTWSIKRTDDSGAKWEAQGNVASRDFDATEEFEVELDFDEPFVSKLIMTNSGPDYRFSQSLAGKSGERLTLLRNGNQAPAPKLRIKSKDGKYERTFSFEYG